MVISDLEHLEVVAEENSIVGGTSKTQELILAILQPKQSADAKALADAVAKGQVTATKTETSTLAIAGELSASSSNSQSSASNPAKVLIISSH